RSRKIDQKVFEIFPFIHQVTDNDEAVYKACKSVIEDYIDDNVKYLELRSAPKFNTKTGMSCGSYVAALIRAIEDASENGDIVVKLLLSIDRTRSLELARETINLALSNVNYVVGIDLSGDPRSDGRKFIDLLNYIKRSSNLKIALHLAEVPNMNEEIEQFLELNLADRIGHGTFLHECSPKILEKIWRQKTPIEICLTSNVKCGTVKSYANHHYDIWRHKNPIILCTDDKGVFATNLSQEYSIAAKCYDLSSKNVSALAQNGFKYAFIDDNSKNLMLDKYFS
uniref:Adenosine deaminase domain-containing protein n=1 Tax=Romanomermis culicivorax TaxID=13658 RepID=A0A915L3L8_ROMCU